MQYCELQRTRKQKVNKFKPRKKHTAGLVQSEKNRQTFQSGSQPPPPVPSHAILSLSVFRNFLIFITAQSIFELKIECNAAKLQISIDRGEGSDKAEIRSRGGGKSNTTVSEVDSRADKPCTHENYKHRAHSKSDHRHHQIQSWRHHLSAKG